MISHSSYYGCYWSVVLLQYPITRYHHFPPRFVYKHQMKGLIYETWLLPVCQGSGVRRKEKRGIVVHAHPEMKIERAVKEVLTVYLELEAARTK